MMMGASITSAQETSLYSTGFESTDGFTAGTVYNNPTVAFTGASGSQWGTYFGTPSTTSAIIGSQSMQMRWYTATPSSQGYTYTNFDKPNVTRVTFNAANTAGINLIVSYSTDGGSSYTGAQTFTLTTTSAPYTYTLSTDPAGFASPVRFKFQLTYTTTPSGTSRLYLDNVVIYGIPPATPQAATPSISAVTGNYWSSQSVTLTCSTPSSSIYYTLDGTTPTNASTLYSGAITVNSTQTIKAIAYASGYTASALNTSVLTFPTLISNIAALRAASTSGFYKLTGKVVLTYQSPATNAKPKFVQDATGGLYIYDATGKMTTTYNVGDSISGLVGTISLYGGYILEFMPVADAGAATSTGNTIIPQITTLANIGNYPSQLVTVKNAAITGTGNFAVSTTYTINDGTAGKLRTFFTDLPYLLTTPTLAIPTVNQDITGVVYNGSLTEVDLIPRTAADFVTSPAISVVESSVPNMSVDVPSRTLTVSGTNLTGDITLAISGTNAAQFDVNPKTLTQTAGAVSSASVTISYTNGSASDAAVLTLSSPGATSKTFNLAGGITTGISQVAQNLSVSVSDGSISFNSEAGKTVELYNAVGQKLLMKQTNAGMNSLTVTAKGLVVVKIGNQIAKVLM